MDRHAEALDLAIERGLVERSGAHHSLDGERIGQGRERAADWLRANPEAFERLVGRVRERAHEAGPPRVAPAEEAAG